MYVPDQYKIQKMFGKVILENDGMKFIPDCCKN